MRTQQEVWRLQLWTLTSLTRSLPLRPPATFLTS
jgi:hypothetical protein